MSSMARTRAARRAQRELGSMRSRRREKNTTRYREHVVFDGAMVGAELVDELCNLRVGLGGGSHRDGLGGLFTVGKGRGEVGTQGPAGGWFCTPTSYRECPRRGLPASPTCAKPSLSTMKPSPILRPLRFALVGCGRIAPSHIEALARHREVRRACRGLRHRSQRLSPWPRRVRRHRAIARWISCLRRVTATSLSVTLSGLHASQAFAPRKRVGMW